MQTYLRKHLFLMRTLALRCNQTLLLLFSVIAITVISVPLSAQSLQEFIRELTSAGLVSNTPIAGGKQTQDNASHGQINGKQPDAQGSQKNLVLGSGEFVTVEPGDTLMGIAKRELGDAELWRDICSLNQIQNQCNTIAVSQRLELPTSVFNYRAELKASLKYSSELQLLRQQNSELGNNLRLTQKQLANTKNILAGERAIRAEKQKNYQNEIATVQRTASQYLTDNKNLKETNKSLKLKIAELENSLKSLDKVGVRDTLTKDEVLGEQSPPSRLTIDDTNNGSTVSVLVNDKAMTLRNLDGNPIKQATWTYEQAFVFPDRILVLRQIRDTGTRSLVKFDNDGNFLSRTGALQQHQLEAQTQWDLDNDGRIGKEKTVEESGTAALIMNPFGHYQVKIGNVKYDLLNANRDKQSPNKKFQILHIEPFRGGLLALQKRNDRIYTVRYSLTGEFQDTYTIKSYAKFFTTTGTD